MNSRINSREKILKRYFVYKSPSYMEKEEHELINKLRRDYINKVIEEKEQKENQRKKKKSFLYKLSRLFFH